MEGSDYYSACSDSLVCLLLGYLWIHMEKQFEPGTLLDLR